MRKMAHVEKVLALHPIEGADKIEVAEVLGWNVVVGKGEFQVGDLAVYFEVDSFLSAEHPAFNTEVFQPRFSNWGTKRGMRVKIIKLRGQVSQGLLMPISKFPEIQDKYMLTLEEGTDVSDLLKVEKYEPLEETQSNNGGINKVAGGGMFPSFLRKTDQERVQNLLRELPKHVDETFEVTIKLDGSSMTVFCVGQNSPHFKHILEDMRAREAKRLSGLKKFWYNLKKKFGWLEKPESFMGVCSRNIELPLAEGNHFSTYVREHGTLEALQNYCRENDCNLAIQGELIAPSIQGNYEQVQGSEYHIFDVFDIDAQAYLPPKTARGIAAALGISYVPVLSEEMPLSVFGNVAEDAKGVVDSLVRFADGPGMNKGVKREGVTFKSNKAKSEFSFKVISESYLLKKEQKLGKEV